MATVAEYEITDLLEQAGCHPRGNRHDCPKCGGLRTVAHSAEAFFCHRCQWKGNAVTLEKELGVYQRITSAEYQELRRRRDRAHDAALGLYSVVHQRQLDLRDDLRTLGHIELGAHRAGPSETVWNALGMVYSERPVIESELDLLESGNAGTVLECLSGAKV